MSEINENRGAEAIEQYNGLPLYFAKTLASLEDFLEKELIELGCIGVNQAKRGVEFHADMATLFKVCLSSRFALTVLRPVLMFDAQDPDALYEEAKRWDWGAIMTPQSSFSIDTTVHSSVFTHSQFAMLRLKDAVVDHFREYSGLRPGINKEDPDIRIHLHIAHTTVTISLDAAGRPLSRRGYRPAGAKAPLNEVLAAGLLAHAGWKPGIPLYDAMCGSGTFTLEAALWADGYPIQWHRRKFAFMDWRGFDEDEWWAVRDGLKAQRQPVDTKLFSSDRDFASISQTRQALANMELAGRAELGRVDFFKLKPRSESGLLVLNPPYGERLPLEDAPAFYSKIGDALKANWSGHSAWIISSDVEGLKRVGLKTKRRIKCFNGPMECRWMGWDLYEGTGQPSTETSAENEA